MKEPLVYCYFWLVCRLKETFLYEKQISQPNYTQYRTQLDCVCPSTLLVAPLFWFGSQTLNWFHGVTWFLRFLKSRAKILAHICIPRGIQWQETNLHICTAMNWSALWRRRSQINKNILSISDYSPMYCSPRNTSMPEKLDSSDCDDYDYNIYICSLF